MKKSPYCPGRVKCSSWSVRDLGVGLPKLRQLECGSLGNVKVVLGQGMKNEYVGRQKQPKESASMRCSTGTFLDPPVVSVSLGLPHLAAFGLTGLEGAGESQVVAVLAL